MVYWFFYFLNYVLGLIYFPTKVYGKENIPRKGSFIFASNHASNIDPIVLGLTAQRRICYMAKDSLFKNKILAAILRKVEAFPMNREGGDVKALREALRRLKAGLPLVVFPSGTRIASPKISDAKAGVGFLVAKSKVPVIPVKIIGSDIMLPPHSRWFKRHPLTVIVGPPMHFEPNQEYAEIAGNILSTIDSLKP